MEYSIYLIKPDAFLSRESIHAELEAGFRIREYVIFNMTERMIDALYPNDVGAAHHPALLEYMTESPVEMGILMGENAISRLLAMAGEKSHPEKCNQGTIRRKYGAGLDKTRSGLYIVKNAIHRPKNEQEFLEDLKIYRSLDGAHIKIEGDYGNHIQE